MKIPRAGDVALPAIGMLLFLVGCTQAPEGGPPKAESQGVTLTSLNRARPERTEFRYAIALYQGTVQSLCPIDPDPTLRPQEERRDARFQAVVARIGGTPLKFDLDAAMDDAARARSISIQEVDCAELNGVADEQDRKWARDSLLESNDALTSIEKSAAAALAKV